MTVLADAFERIEESQSLFDDHLDRNLWNPDDQNDPGVRILRHNQRIHDHYEKVLAHLAAAFRTAVNQHQGEGAEEGSGVPVANPARVRSFDMEEERTP